MAREDISIQTKDGACRSFVFTPGGAGPWPAVIFFMDGLAIRPILFEMAQRIADFGYVVLLPDMFYRAGPYEPLDPKAVFASGNIRGAIGHLMGSTNNQRAGEDAGAFIAYLDTRSDVAGKKIGCHGYCMGGAIALTAAAMYPDRIAAAATFHAGNLATDDALSPHLKFSEIKAAVYIGAADNDGIYPPAMAAKTIEALMNAHVAYQHDLYKDAAHGWTMADFPIYRREDSERHFEELRALYGAHLR